MLVYIQEVERIVESWDTRKVAILTTILIGPLNLEIKVMLFFACALRQLTVTRL